MPHKNPWCRGTKKNPHYPTKMKHHKWLEKYPNYGTDNHYKRELICPICGKTRTDIKARWGKIPVKVTNFTLVTTRKSKSSEINDLVSIHE